MLHAQHPRAARQEVPRVVERVESCRCSAIPSLRNTGSLAIMSMLLCTTILMNVTSDHKPQTTEH